MDHVDSFIVDNPLGRGPHWASPMDVAIRSANWVLAVVLFAPDGEIPIQFWGRMLADLHSAGLFLERNLEWHPVYRGNHYVANGVGLVYLGTLFCGTREGDRWMRLGSRILRDEILWQIRPDGVSFEASLAYHRLVTEFFTYGSELVRRNDASAWPPDCDDRLRAMYRFLDAYLPPGGEAPMIGDADDGRLHLLVARSIDHPRRHALGLPRDRFPVRVVRPAEFADGGFYVMGAGDDHAVIRCGPVGLNGAGSHDHNDQLGFELVMGGRRIVSDAGTFVYTADLAARHAFRSTASHSVLSLGGEEQNPIRVDRPWRVMGDRTRANCVRWVAGPHRQIFHGRHFGFAHRESAAVCDRVIIYSPDNGSWTIEDAVSGRGEDIMHWRMHFPHSDVAILSREPGHLDLKIGEIILRIVYPDGLTASVESSQQSLAYGSRSYGTCVEIAGTVRLPLTLRSHFTPSNPERPPAGSVERSLTTSGAA